MTDPDLSEQMYLPQQSVGLALIVESAKPGCENGACYCHTSDSAKGVCDDEALCICACCRGGEADAAGRTIDCSFSASGRGRAGGMSTPWSAR